MRISRRTLPLIPGVLIGFLTFGGGMAQAGPLTYNESAYAGADFPASGNPNIGSLDVGVNTITGVLSYQFLDQDTFSVTLPSGLEITSGSWAIIGIQGQTFSGEPSGSVDEPLDGLTDISSSGTLNLTAPYTTAGDLDAEVAGLNPCNTGTPPVCVFEGFSYTLEYTVADIPQSSTPEPGTLGLFASAVAVGGFLRRRRQMISTWSLIRQKSRR